MIETDKPCAKCGAQDRYKNGKCGPCAKVLNAAWRKANLETCAAYTTLYRKNNIDKVRAKNRAW